jgi:anhydro-N-acetylmuramic acid kinase
VTRVVGLMSGTSVDAIDVAVADFVADGDVLHLRCRGDLELPMPPGLRERVLAVLPPATPGTEEICRLDADLGMAFADAADRAIEVLGDGSVDLVVSHGQTLHHDVQDGSVRGTLQVGQPAIIAERTGVEVLADLRARDVAAGGQGAPLVAILDELLLRGHDVPAACCNLGGIANLTVVTPAAPTIAFDAGPANALLDLAVRRFSDGRITRDTDGALAAAGTVDASLLSVLLADDYLDRPPPKSTGKERYNGPYLDAALAAAPVASLEDLLATLCAAAAQAVVAAAARSEVGVVYASGGGAHNRALMEHLRRGLDSHGAHLRTTDDLGMPGDAKEAYAMALIGYLTWHGIPANVPSATGARGPRLLGSVTPGRDPQDRPVPGVRPTHLVLEPSGVDGPDTTMVTTGTREGS